MEETLNNIYDTGCTLCKFHKNCKNVCINGSGGTEEGKLMVIFDYPSAKDDENNTVMEYDGLFDYVASEVVGIAPEDMFKTYALKCRDTEYKKPTAKDINACKSYLIQEIEELKPKAILVLGEVALKMLTGQQKISKYKGIVQRIEITPNVTTSVIASYSPFYVKNAEEYLQSWAGDINLAYQTANDIVPSVSETQIVYCENPAKFREGLQYCVDMGVCAFDFETPKVESKGKGTFKEGHHATMLSVTFQTGSAYVIPIEHKDSPLTKEDVSEVMEDFRTMILENPKVRKVAHNLNYDHHINRIYGNIKLRGRIDDTMLMYHLINELERKGLKDLVAKYFPEFAGYEESLEGFGWENIPIRTLAQYNGTDTDMTYRLMVQLEKELLEDERIYLIYRNLSMAAFRPLFEAEARGALVDNEYLGKAIKEVQEIEAKQVEILNKNSIVRRYVQGVNADLVAEKISEITEKLNTWMETHKSGLKTEMNMREKLSGLRTGQIIMYEELNYKSPKQLVDFLYDSPYGFQFKGYQRTTGEEVISEIHDDTGFIDNLLHLRKIQKILNTYLIGIYERLDANSRVHTSFKLAGTVSGRLSSANPNLQNIPNVGKITNDVLRSIVERVKQSFIAPEGNKFVQGDYSQAELRIIASLAKEENMLQVYQNDGDMHTMTASTLMGYDTLEDFKEKEDAKSQKAGRTKAKAANFGLIYKISVDGYMDYAKNNYGVELTSKEAEEHVDRFFGKYPKILEYHDIYEAKAQKFGYVRTLFGRKRLTPNILSDDGFRRGQDERVAVNSPVQGTAGEFTIFAIALLYLRLDPSVELCITVHDSIMFYIPDEILESQLKIIKLTMEDLPMEQYFGRVLYGVKMKADFEISNNSWNELEEYEL